MDFFKGEIMNTSYDYLNKLEFDKIKEKLSFYAATEYARNKIAKLEPMLSESELKRAMNETNGARRMLDSTGNVEISKTEEIKSLMEIADKQGILYPEQLERILLFTVSCRRLKSYLKKAETTETALAFTGGSIDTLDEIYTEINRCIRGDNLTDNASWELSGIRRSISNTETQIKVKLDEIIKSKKKYCTDSFVSVKNGHYTLPVKKEYKNQISGTLITTSSSGTTLFIEPSAAIKLTEKLNELQIQEEMEKQRLLYVITSLVDSYKIQISVNIEVMETLDFAFAKAKLSQELDCTPPKINTDGYMKIEKGRHPLLDKDRCVPVDFEIGNNGVRGIVITGPNTGGKTVTLKLVGLFCVMAQCGLHLPCESADISMRSNVLCDIGDGQNISQNLSTFSAHITNIVDILSATGKESLVLLDELGSGTDPAEGMGIAVSILEELRKRNCIFVATTHYPEVKSYAEEKKELLNARMSFDKETLQPLYHLVIGEAGQSCAFYIAKKLGFPDSLLKYAYEQTYRRKAELLNPEEKMKFDVKEESTLKVSVPSISKSPVKKALSEHAVSFSMGDSVIVYPSKEIGIVYKPADDMGNLIVQVKGVKKIINHKRLELKMSADKLYPPDYDFSIIFDSVENRKASHQMTKHHNPDLVIKVEE